MAKARTAQEPRQDMLKQHLQQFKCGTAKALLTCATTFGILAMSIVFVVLYPCWLASLVFAGAMVRTFVLFHDCSHMALFPSRSANVLAARLAEPFIIRSMEGWSQSHNHHHKVVSSDPPPHNFPFGWWAQLTSKAIDDSRTVLFSKQEYERQPIFTRLTWRMFRDPFFFFGVAVPGQWFFRPQEWRSSCGHVPLAVMICMVGGRQAAVSYYAGGWMSLVIAGLLFHLQHQVNPGYWKDEAHGYTKVDACLKGTSYLLVPWWLKWVTLSIEYHHIHHFSVRVPCYELQPCHESAPEHLFCDVVEVSMAKAFRSCFHAMWDEDTETYVSFDVYRMLGLQD